MRLTLPDGSVAEGSAIELADFFSHNQFHKSPQSSAKPEMPSEALPVVDFRFVSEDVASRALNRLKLSPAQLKLLKALYISDGKWVLATELQRAVGYSASQFAGLMGAFGRRVAYTPGFVVDSSFFEIDWDYEKGCYRYKLPQAVRNAVGRLGLV